MKIPHKRSFLAAYRTYKSGQELLLAIGAPLDNVTCFIIIVYNHHNTLPLGIRSSVHRARDPPLRLPVRGLYSFTPPVIEVTRLPLKQFFFCIPRASNPISRVSPPVRLLRVSPSVRQRLRPVPHVRGGEGHRDDVSPGPGLQPRHGKMRLA